MLPTQELKSRARITALGVYTPEKRLTNKDLEQTVETNDEWIVQRTGIRERRIAADQEYTSDLCVHAARNLAERHGVVLEDVDFIIVSTTTPDYPLPSVSSQVQSRLGIPHAGAIDLQAACAGFVYALHLANSLVTTGLHKKILVLGAETLSKVTDYSDRSTCILFGDGAGAMLVEYDEHEPSFLSAHVGSEGEGGKSLYRSGTSTTMDGVELIGNGNIVQNGREVYKWAVSTLTREIPKWLERDGHSLSEVDWFVPHSANLRIIESVCERLQYPLEQTLNSVEYFGNTSSATIPLSIDIALQEGKIKKGDTMLLYGFGGGLVHAGALIKWTV
ncbi:ketoacyl-ACP synthase III [Tumebacillus sp. DT12]|uniref:Beta-ketoacyl-[acyl-carrier-protein] synthase III n=1 Tax=Tumebacillus lacus TaxID=2995335 RepID=A0ABT3X285_9BACL|nr:ketoacyl-ACP synthase III [Tumebacillus lacus]MCX7569736.1 ketoacyl-ACP synthase III [Tumebacillus lacus]